MLVGTIKKHTALCALMMIATVSCVLGSEKTQVATRSKSDKESRVIILKDARKQEKEDKDHPIAQSLDHLQRIVEEEQRVRFNSQARETEKPKSVSRANQDVVVFQRHEEAQQYFADGQKKRKEDKEQRDIQAEKDLKKQLRKNQLNAKRAAEQEVYNEQTNQQLAAKDAFIKNAEDCFLEEEVVVVPKLSKAFPKEKTIRRKKETSKQPVLADVPAYTPADQNIVTPVKTSRPKTAHLYSANKPAITREAHKQNPKRMTERSQNMQLNATKKNSGGTYDGTAKNIVDSFAKKPNS